MAGQPDCFTLNVPVDAGPIKTDAEPQDVRVAVRTRDGSFTSQTVTLEPGGSAIASFAFDEHPGGVQLLLGPAKATAEELAKLQTLTVDLPGHRWRDGELSLEPIVVSPYFWWWWWGWCRDFTIRGKVVCADGSPVPGATVTAFDVDWWWWWSSKQAIASATTDINGTFEIDFSWCCAWWPSWWWKARVWDLSPSLVESVQAIVERDPQLRLGRTTVQPSLSAFSEILGEQDAGRLQRALGPDDVGQLEQMRTKLLQKLPPSTELESLRVWPWVPWYPWWDCAPDVTFTVTQDCHAPGTVILDEGIGETRYDIAQTTDVILVANDEACCRKSCDGPCPEGHCIDIADICGASIDRIGGNGGAAAAPVGHLYPGEVVAGSNGIQGDRPFAGIVNVTNANFMLDVDYYEIEYRPHGSLNWLKLPAGGAVDFYRHWVAPPIGGIGPWQSGDVLFAFSNRVTALGPVDVVESREHWEATTGGLPAGYFWTSNWFLVVPLDSTKFGTGDGTYDFHVVGWTLNPDGTLGDGETLPVCESKLENEWVLAFNNRADPDLTALTPCGTGTVTACVTEPGTQFVSVRVDGVTVDACSTIDVTDASVLEIEFIASDSAGYLANYALTSHYGNSAVISLPVTAANTTLLLGDHIGPTYGQALGQGAGAPYWKGGTMLMTIKAKAAFPIPCCYELRLTANSRDVVNCDGQFAWHNVSEYSVGVGLCPPPHEFVADVPAIAIER